MMFGVWEGRCSRCYWGFCRLLDSGLGKEYYMLQELGVELGEDWDETSKRILEKGESRAQLARRVRKSKEAIARYLEEVHVPEDEKIVVITHNTFLVQYLGMKKSKVAKIRNCEFINDPTNFDEVLNES
uniref:Phosphoglycerate mutase n=1 Tax=Euplotes harpa TaxID=151035 RepID=A0A7S3NH37_9SPIT